MAQRKARLPNDIIGQLEDRITDDDTDFQAYEELIAKYKEKSKIDEARQTFQRLLKVLPASAYVWRQYAEMETAANEFVRVEQIFSECLMACLHIDIWSYYLDYVRRMNNLSTGGSQARSVISQAYEFVLQHVGIDIAAGQIWSDYITFLKSAPASSTWEEQQKNDQIRKTYQRAVVTPLKNIEALWRDYNTFETSVNKQTARKFLNDKSPAYMTARASSKELTAILDPLRVHNFPPKPTRTGSDNVFIAGWRKWIAHERGDPLELEESSLKGRMRYAFKQCLMLCRFHPEMWFEAAAYWESINEDNSAMCKEGLTANPKSWLLSFAYAEVEELAKRNENVKATYESLLTSNEREISKIESDAALAIEAAKVEEQKKITMSSSASSSSSDSSSDDEEDHQPAAATQSRTVALETERDSKIKALAEEGTVASIMYMRAMRRLEGIKAARQAFARGIKIPHHSWHIYVASALMEHQTSKETPIAVKIFARGLKLFPDNAEYILEYLNFLLNICDDTNARALFEQTISKLDTKHARTLYARWYEYESMFGDLEASKRLAARIGEIEPISTPLTRFSQRYSYLGCDPIATRDLGLKKSAPNIRRGLPAHPLGFPPIPIPGSIPPPPLPGTNGFNPPILRPEVPVMRESPAPAPIPISVPLPPPIHPVLMNLIRDLPPNSHLDSRMSFNHKEILQIVRDTDLSRASRASATPQPTSQPQPQVTKRTAAQMIPQPDDVIALGRHNDPRDPYKKRAL